MARYLSLELNVEATAIVAVAGRNVDRGQPVTIDDIRFERRQVGAPLQAGPIELADVEDLVRGLHRARVVQHPRRVGRIEMVGVHVDGRDREMVAVDPVVAVQDELARSQALDVGADGPGPDSR